MEITDTDSCMFTRGDGVAFRLMAILLCFKDLLNIRSPYHVFTLKGGRLTTAPTAVYGIVLTAPGCLPSSTFTVFKMTGNTNQVNIRLVTFSIFQNHY